MTKNCCSGGYPPNISFFNTVSVGNIGLENFMKQDSSVESVIVVLKQNRTDAQAVLDEMYPQSRAVIVSFRDGWFYAFRCLLQLRPFVAHAHHAQAALVTAVLRLLGQIRFVTTAHSNFRHYRVKHKLAFLSAFIMSDRVVCNSEGTRASLPRLISRGKMPVIYNGVDFSKLDGVLGTNQAKHHVDGLLIGTVCRMVPAKDLPTLVRGFAKVVSRSKESVRLRLVGDGPERARVQGLIEELNISEHVELTGAVSRLDVYKNLANMDIFVVSSKWEGFCNAMVEAAAAGKPIIASNIDPLPEVIGKTNAEFFPVGDSEALSNALLDLVDDELKRKQLAASACDFVRSRYSLVASAGRYARIYETLAGELDVD